ncbi:MAG: hypothetical protein ACRD2M_06865, partial [Terriglobales bacterium]
VQYSLNRLAEYILEKRIDYKQASLLIWIMQIAAANARHTRLEPFQKEDIVREHPDDRYFANPDAPSNEGSESADPEDSVIAVSSDDLEALGEFAPSADFSAPPATSALKVVDSKPETRNPKPVSSVPLSEGHGFNRAAPKRKIRALAPEANSAGASAAHSAASDSEIAVSDADLAELVPFLDSPASPASSAVDHFSSDARKRPTRQELDDLVARAIEKFRNTPYIEEAPPQKSRRKS